MTTNRIAFQGEPGAYSHEACRTARPQMDALPCRTFEDVIEAVRSHEADLAMLPVENSTYGRVADIHHLLPESGLHIIEEAFVRVHISLLAVPGTPLSEVREAMSHTVLLGQCRGFLRQHGIRSLTGADTAGSAKEIEDRQNNTTRFLIMSRQPDFSRRSDRMLTSFVFRVRNIPAALYKAMGGFATNGVNMTKLESYMVDGVFTATQFYADVEGHPEDENLRRALDELGYFTSSLDVLGVYPADPLREAQRQPTGA
jgi:prephenate dehydratase